MMRHAIVVAVAAAGLSSLGSGTAEAYCIPLNPETPYAGYGICYSTGECVTVVQYFRLPVVGQFPVTTGPVCA